MSDEYEEPEWLYLGHEIEPPDYQSDGDSQDVLPDTDETPF